LGVGCTSAVTYHPPAALPCRPTLASQLLVKWWAEYPAELLETRVVKPLQKYLTDELYATKKLTIRWGRVAQGG